MVNVLEYIIGGFRRVRSSLTTSIWSVGNPPVYSEIDNERAIKDGFNSNTAVYSIVNRFAEKFASIPRYVYSTEEKEEKAYEPIEENDLTNLLNRPNEYQSQDAFFKTVMVYKKLLDESFIWLNRGDVNEMWVEESGEFVERTDEQYSAMPVLEMYVLPADRMIVVPDPENLWGVLSYILDADGKYVKIRKADVIHWKGTNLEFSATTRSHLRGRSPLRSGSRTLQLSNDVEFSMMRAVQNDGSKGVLTNETLDKMTPEQQTQIKRVIDAKVNNADVKGAVATLQGKWNYFQLNSGIDLHLNEITELIWKQLSYLLDTPYEFFDSHTPFAEKQLTQKGWVFNSIMPACKQLDGEMNRALLPAFKLIGKAFIECDYSEMAEMQEDKQALATALNTAWWITPNEAREEMGYEKVEDEIYDEIWVPTGRTPSSQMNDAAEMEMITQELMNRQIGKNGQQRNKKESV